MTVALAAYFDDSVMPHVYTLAGYLARVETWDKVFDPLWKPVLRKYGVSEFKASDCRQQSGEFEGWERKRCDAITKDVVSVIADKTPKDQFFGYGVAMVFPGPAQRSEDRRTVEEIGFSACFVTAVQNVIVFAMRHMAEGEKLQIIFDKKPSFHQIATEHYDTLAEHFGPDIARRINHPMFQDSRDVVALQAADLLAYETRKEVQNRAEAVKRDVSKALERLVGSRLHDADLMTWGQYLRGMEAIRLGHRPMMHPELVPYPLFKSGDPWRAPHQWPYVDRGWTVDS